jgi:hypothetical protein
MRLVWLNAWGGAVWPAFGDWIAALAPDVLFLQEVIRAPVPSPEWLIYADRIGGSTSGRTSSPMSRPACRASGLLRAGGTGAAEGPGRAILHLRAWSGHGSRGSGGVGLRHAVRARPLSARRVGTGACAAHHADDAAPRQGFRARIGRSSASRLRDPGGKDDTPAHAAGRSHGGGALGHSQPR